MSGHENRKFQKMSHIKKSTIELCNKYGKQKVKIDEIAKHANVSKVTIYKYFDSKENLISTIINEIYSNIISSAKKMIESEGDFLKKLNIIMQSKISYFSIFNGDFLEELFLNSNTEAFNSFNKQIKSLMLDFFEDGKSQGYIDNSISNESLYLYSEIFNTGLQSIIKKEVGLLRNTEMMSKFIDLYFYGLIKTG